MNKKKTIRLNENQLRRIVKESVKRVLKENNTVTQNKGDWEKCITIKDLKRDLNMGVAAATGDNTPICIRIDGREFMACHIGEQDGKYIIDGSWMNWPEEKIDFQNDDVRKSFRKERDFLLNKDYDLK